MRPEGGNDGVEYGFRSIATGIRKIIRDENQTSSSSKKKWKLPVGSDTRGKDGTTMWGFGKRSLAIHRVAAVLIYYAETVGNMVGLCLVMLTFGSW